ncbi:MAG: proton-conducting transporter membrane subunit [bacterium]|nr:proton-conducting transporter membrane subunit [bacterium]
MFLIFITIFSYFAAFLAILSVGKRKNAAGGYIALSLSVVSFVSFLALCFSPGLQREFIFATYRISGFTFDFGFLVDKLSLLMGGIVSFVTTLVLAYSRDYMRDDAEKGRFFALLCFFAGSMLGIVYSASLAQMIVFWEFVGLSSYFLIGFWWRDPVVASSARKVFTTIVVGDVCLLLGALVLGQAFGTFTFSQMIQGYNHIVLPAAGVFLVLLGAFTKSAQLPFSMWLPWAMEGPTPVSALLHSATMVKAGVFLIARILPLVLASHLAGFVIVFALATVIAASLFALVEEDIKRILAYSTISQLGFIALGLGLGAYGASLFHLFNDAFYKALLFLCAGVVIHAGGSRNIFALKDLDWKKESVFITLSIIGVLGISGMPPFNGFFSKDLIIDAAAASHNTALYGLTLFGAFLSALYISRWLFLILKKVKRVPSEARELPSTTALQHSGTVAHKNTFGLSSKIPMAMLALGVILTGWLVGPFFNWLGVDKPHYDFSVSAASVALAASAFAVSYLVWFKNIVSAERIVRIFGSVYAVLRAKFGIIWFYNVLARFLASLGEALGVFDRYIIDTVLHGAAAFGRSIANIAYAFDRRVIDGMLHGIARGAVAACFVSHRLDTSLIDRAINGFYAVLMAGGERMRLLVSGSAITYAAAIIVGVIASVLMLNGILG